MKTANELIQNPTGQPSSKSSLSTLDADLIDYIFHKIKLTWGDTKFTQTFSDVKTLEDTKRDWAKDLISAMKIRRDHRNQESEEEFIFRAKGRVDRIFSDIRVISADPQRRNWEWPSLKNIVAYMQSFNVPVCHKPFPKQLAIEDEGAKARNQVAGNSALKNLKGLFGSKPDQKNDEECAA